MAAARQAAQSIPSIDRASTGARSTSLSVAYGTSGGVMYRGHAEDVLQSGQFRRYRGKVQLILTSPPFPLNRKKRYGNLQGENFRTWLADFAPAFRSLLTPSGSIVLEMGNAWEPGEPVMSTLALRALLSFLANGNLNLCQQFVCFNKARLPSPAQWVTVERIRVKDSFTHIWWMSPSVRPKANNRHVLVEYSKAMRRLLAIGKYNHGPRPSEHSVGRTSFLKDNGGAIPSNVLTVANTTSSDEYVEYCKKTNLVLHPSRMSREIPNFFIRFLTDPGDLVLDPFAGSNTTGAVAEELSRRWIAIEANGDYARGSRGRFR